MSIATATRLFALKGVVRLLGTTIALLLISLPLFSQSNQGSIQGAVLDQSGGAIIGATVTVIDVARGATRALTTDDAGQYIQRCALHLYGAMFRRIHTEPK